MKTTKSRRVFYFFIVVFLIVFGFFRDYFLKQYNMYLYQLYYNDMTYVVDAEFSFLKKFSYMQLYYAKFLLTIFFCLVYFAVTLLVIKYEFEKRHYLWIVLYFYLAILGTILIFYFYGVMTNQVARFSDISRSFLALLQSPLMLMILYPAFKLSSKKTN